MMAMGTRSAREQAAYELGRMIAADHIRLERLARQAGRTLTEALVEGRGQHRRALRAVLDRMADQR